MNFLQRSSGSIASSSSYDVRAQAACAAHAAEAKAALSGILMLQMLSDLHPPQKLPPVSFSRGFKLCVSVTLDTSFTVLQKEVLN